MYRINIEIAITVIVLATVYSMIHRNHLNEVNRKRELRII